MSDFLSKIYGSIEYNFVDDDIKTIIEGFFSNRDVLDEHLSKANGSSVAFSLPFAKFSNVGIIFFNYSAQFLSVKESIELVVSFLRSLEVKGIKVDIIQVGDDDFDDIVHYKLNDVGQVVQSYATLSFENYYS